MDPTIRIDEINNKILHGLLQDARAKLKDIAKECNISPVSVLNRIKHLKDLGLITKGTIFADPETTLKNQQIRATIGIELDWNQEQQISKLIQEETELIEFSRSIGKFDLVALVQTKSIAELNKIIYRLKKQSGAIKITVMIWSMPYINFENIDLQPTELNRNGQT